MNRFKFWGFRGPSKLGRLLFLAPALFWGRVASGAELGRYLELPLARHAEHAPAEKVVNRDGVPFIVDALPLASGSAASVSFDGRAKRIYFLGMTDSGKPRAWSNPLDYSAHYFVGDRLGNIRLKYADGSEEVFPLILGESVWWGALFWDNPEPFSSDPELRAALAASLRLYPAAPVADGNYVGVIIPKNSAIREIVVEDSGTKRGVLIIAGITVETFGKRVGDNALHLFKSLRREGEDEDGAQRRLEGLRRALYTCDDNFRGQVTASMPPDYAGPTVSFAGTIFAEILTNAFHHNLADMAGKIGEDGTYHTSSKNSVSWGSYNGFGTFQRNVGKYSTQAYSRDLGRSLQELTELGYLDEARRCADYCFRMARRWEEVPSLVYKGTRVPRHWGQVINRSGGAGCFENDGHGLTALFLYKLWQRLPDRETWLRSCWVDVQAAGDWILWQFDHPGISGATAVLHTTGESAGGGSGGNSVYADAICRDALLGLARMADSCGETASAARWRDRAAQMRRAIAAHYLIADGQWGLVWTLASSGWTHHSTVLGPLIFVADFGGFAPEDDDPRWRPANEASYRRMTAAYSPAGFFGQAMGYGQGFATQAALLLDRMREASAMLDWTAREIYDPRIGSYLVPEGCEIDPSGCYWYRVGDLGNGVQEAEIVKALRIMIGVDDTEPGRLRLFPRMPLHWTKLAVERFPILFERDGKGQTAQLRYELERTADRMRLTVSANASLGPLAMRLGPFADRPTQASVEVNGAAQTITPERSGDSWWARFSALVGPVAP